MMKILAIFGALVFGYVMVRTLMAPKPEHKAGDEAVITSKKCPHCGTYVEQSATKCTACGKRL